MKNKKEGRIIKKKRMSFSFLNKMSCQFYPLFKWMAFNLDPELAHELTIKAMKPLGALVKHCGHPSNCDPRLHIKALGLSFNGPIGLAAGLDKNAEAIDYLSFLPFSFIEVGTVTPKAQEGNPKPRLFRYIKEEGLRNAMGFNNLGADKALENIKSSNRQGKILGVNLGKNKLTPNELAPLEYASLYETFCADADYLVINVSSPNTPGLRDLLQDKGLREIFEAVSVKRKKYPKPLLVKISPDMTFPELKSVVSLVKEFKLAGIVATNTAIMPELGPGGVSGKILYEKSKRVRDFLLDELKENPEIELIGVGGFSAFEDLIDFWKRGGRLVQIYSSFIFKGPELLFEIEEKLLAEMERMKVSSFDDFLKELRKSV